MSKSSKLAGGVLAKGLASLLVSVSPLAMGCAHADDAAAPAASTADTGEIVVTATKRSESMQTVPLAMTAMTSEQLTQHHVAGFDDYAKMLPSVSFQSFGPGQSQIYFRGITNGGDGIASGPLPASGLYIDEVPVTTIAGSVDMHVYDISRIEALSGPQGTLYGASSMSGTLRIITNQPKLDKWEGGIDVEGNKFGPGAAGGKVEGFINVPIGNSAALRASAFYQHDGGYIDNTPGERIYVQAGPGLNTYNNAYNNSKYVKNNFNDVNSAGGRAALKVDLSDNWTATPQIMYQNMITHGTFLVGPGGYQSDANTPPLGDLQVHDFAPDRTTDAWYIASLTVQGKISDWDVTYSGSYFDRRQDVVADYSYFTVAYDQMYASSGGYTNYSDANGKPIDPSQIYHSHDKFTKFGQELRISSPAHDRLRLTAGLFMQRQTDAHIADYIVNGMTPAGTLPSAVFPDGVLIPGAPTNDAFYTNLNRVDRDYAAFGEVNYDILPNLTATGGIRGFIANNTLNGFSGGYATFTTFVGLNNCAAGATVFSCPDVNAKLVEHGETHKLSLKWQIDHDAMLYATYSTGFRPGGNNRVALFNGQTQNPGPFRSDTLTNYEIGWKTSLFDRKLRFNGAVFWEEWNNVQYAAPGVQGVIYTVNAGKARSRGVEADVAWRLAHGLTLSGSGTYVDAKLVQDFICLIPPVPGVSASQQPTCSGTAIGAVVAPKGTRLPVTPHVKLSATLRYETTLADFNAFLQGGLTYQGSSTNTLRPDWEQVIGGNAAFTTADFSAGLSKDQWTLSAFISNAFDERGALGKNLACSATVCQAFARNYITKPQQFGLRAGYKF